MTNALVGAKPEQLCHHHAAIPVVACVISKKRNKLNNSSRVESFSLNPLFSLIALIQLFLKTRQSILTSQRPSTYLRHEIGGGVSSSCFVTGPRAYLDLGTKGSILNAQKRGTDSEMPKDVAAKTACLIF